MKHIRKAVLILFVTLLVGCTSLPPSNQTTNTPPAVVVVPDIPDVPDAPPPPPTNVVPDVPAVPTNEAARVRLHQLHVWCESADGTRADDALRRIGWPADRVYVHVWDPARAWSKFGQRVLAIPNPKADGGGLWDTLPKDLPGAVDGLCRRAKAAGCVAVSVDAENWWVIDPAFLKTLHAATKRHNLPLWTVPAIGLNHFLVSKASDDWAWTRTDRGRAGLTPEQVGKVFQDNSEGQLQWYYGANAQAFIDARNATEQIGYTRPFVPLMDAVGRIPDAAAADMVRKLIDEIGAIGLFHGGKVGPLMIQALREAKDKQ